MSKHQVKMIYCCGCGCDVQARLTNGKEIYPHRMDLDEVPFWKCDKCGNYVGCHHKTKQRTSPTGCIPTSEIRALRVQIHNIIDPLWKSVKSVVGRCTEKSVSILVTFITPVKSSRSKKPKK